MATSLTLQNDASLAQGYVKVNGTTSATFTTSGITGNLTGSLTAGGSLTLATAQTASGTSVDFTGIPSWAKRVTVMLNGVSLNGLSHLLFQIGTSGGIQSTGYIGVSVDGPTITGLSSTSGIPARIGEATASLSGTITFSLLNSSTGVWTSSGTFARSDGSVFSSSQGGKTLSATLDRVRITTVNGTDTFDAGTINISFEG